MDLSQLLPWRALDPVLVDEAADLGGSLVQEPVPSPDEEEEVAQVSAEGGSSGGARDILGCLGQASLKLREDLRLEQDLLEVEEARGRGAPFTPEEVEVALRALAVEVSSVGAEILLLPVFPAGLAARHVRPHVDGEVVGAGEEGSVEPVLEAEGEALVPEEVQQVREGRVVL